MTESVLPRESEAKRNRVDPPHELLSSDAANSNATTDDSKWLGLAGRDPKVTTQQVDRQASELLTYVREQNKEIDQRQAEINAKLAQLDNQLRNARLKTTLTTGSDLFGEEATETPLLDSGIELDALDPLKSNGTPLADHQNATEEEPEVASDSVAELGFVQEEVDVRINHFHSAHTEPVTYQEFEEVEHLVARFASNPMAETFDQPEAASVLEQNTEEELPVERSDDAGKQVLNADTFTDFRLEETAEVDQQHLVDFRADGEFDDDFRLDEESMLDMKFRGLNDSHLEELPPSEATRQAQNETYGTDDAEVDKLFLKDEAHPRSPVGFASFQRNEEFEAHLELNFEEDHEQEPPTISSQSIEESKAQHAADVDISDAPVDAFPDMLAKSHLRRIDGAAPFRSDTDALESERRLLADRKLELDRRGVVLGRMQEEAKALHREALEMRLVTEQLWSQLSESTPSDQLSELIANLRSQLDSHYSQEQTTLENRRQELVSAQQILEKKHESLREQANQLQTWFADRQDDIQQRASEVDARESLLDQREHRMQEEFAKWEAQRKSYQGQLKGLMGKLKTNGLV